MFGKLKNRMNDRDAKLREMEADISRTRTELTRNVPSVVDEEVSGMEKALIN